MSTYQPRIIDTELDALLRSFPAVALDGPKGVGKTSTAARRAHTIYRLDHSAQRALLDAAPSICTRRRAPCWLHHVLLLVVGALFLLRVARPKGVGGSS